MFRHWKTGPQDIIFSSEWEEGARTQAWICRPELSSSVTARVLTARLQREAEWRLGVVLRFTPERWRFPPPRYSAISESMKGDFLRAVLHLTQADSHFGNVLAELLMSHWAEDDASVWTEIENFPCETFSCRAPMGDELREIYCLSHISQCDV